MNNLNRTELQFPYNYVFLLVFINVYVSPFCQIFFTNSHALCLLFDHVLTMNECFKLFLNVYCSLNGVALVKIVILTRTQLLQISV
jgi:hypothetical protein